MNMPPHQGRGNNGPEAEETRTYIVVGKTSEMTSLRVMPPNREWLMRLAAGEFGKWRAILL
jgi:hypothetical protein